MSPQSSTSRPLISNPVVPFSEPAYLTGLPSPYYNDSHYAWQAHCRSFISSQFANALSWEDEGDVPETLFKTFADANMIVPAFPAPLPVEQLKAAGIHEFASGLKVEDFDYFHSMIYTDEMLRIGLSGPAASINTGVAYGIPPLYKFGSPALQRRFLPDLFHGRTRCCIAITEPSAGSDVANISTTATKSSCGKYYIVTGQKKWITNGIWSDYATMAVRTGGPGPNGISLLFVPLKENEGKGVERRRIKISGGGTSGTTFIDLDEVKVPVENLIGKEGMGMKYIMTNFNHERLTIAIGATRSARVVLAAAAEYVMKREAFGKTLVEQPVVRHRIAKCAVMLESQWAWVEQIVYMMQKLEKKVGDVELGGMTAMCKANSGMVLSECSQCAVLLFGGNGLTRSGLGETVEKIFREVNVVRIPGGSEDVLLDLGVRQLVKIFQAKTLALEATRGSKL
ncbi:hypothetical protein TWF173_001602 [Orbilia oligospora]|uniref:Acyl-CoA dehydrogenase n=2 Tax=Orbilia oligospora TaxID=2813651 RepID=G1XNV4_ARTOA|nr:hypothetical protein AOL_s00173g122 [Orbilia oligospora ATCC 24927]EGX45021.1 hypothetical protein AOL_s00173g122 [Orbilia oligospora ATCC 24927]KAF3286725.1 hypothetical protein TWF970_008569 [Orbilia oligospora]KAF3308235.1 hypothetical protein TWF173_001602 [Orbilia oligospora]